MKKYFLVILMLFVSFSTIRANAVEIKIEGTGTAQITGYDVNAVRENQDINMKQNSVSANYQWTQNKSFDKAIKQGETREKQDAQLQGVVRSSIVNQAQQNALENAVKILIDRTLGVNASNNPQIIDKFNDLISQSSTYILSQNYTGDVKDNLYTAKGYFVVDETLFRELLSDLGLALNTQNVRASSILTVIDEFFTLPSDLNISEPTKDITTYKYSNDEKYKEKEALKYGSSEKSAGAVNTFYGSAKAGYSNKEALKYGYFQDYSNKENEFFQHIVEYQPKAPRIQNVNYTLPALQSSFQTYDIRAIDNDMFKSKYFKNNPVTVDKLTNSAELANYIKFARKDAKADFFAIGTSVITDSGINPNIGQHVCDGMVAVKVYSTQDGEVIASGSISETAAGQSVDQARALVAEKVGKDLGEVLSKKIQDYWKKRMMYGSEYVVLVNGSFTPMERIALNKTLKTVNGIQNVTLRSTGQDQCEFVINYKGLDSFGDAVFMTLAESPIADRFMNYDYEMNGNQIVFSPIKQQKNEAGFVPVKNVKPRVKK
ncbi:MAG: hypothetical protein PHC34_02545 [Candidatus Gastranaerophilales bacterium]|nr:hypothetical protein [Candidatus Gastranaerophilales bacterium]